MNLTSSRLGLGCCAVACMAIAGVTNAADAAPSASPTPTEFTMSGSIDGLYPGFIGTLEVRVVNPFDRDIRLTTLTTTTVANEPVIVRCGRHLAVGGLHGQPIVPARAELDVDLPVSFDRAAPDECQAVTVPLRFTAEATAVEPALPDTTAPAPPDTTMPDPSAPASTAAGMGPSAAAAPSPFAGPLPRTGSDTASLAYFAAAALFAGAVILALGRSRRRNQRRWRRS